MKNYTGNLEDVFTCIAALGESGCGFEHQFAAITRALGVEHQPGLAGGTRDPKIDQICKVVVVDQNV